MGIARRLQKNPKFLEKAYDLMRWSVVKFEPLISRIGHDRFDRLFGPPEEWGKKAVFDCRMCGQCILHSTGMTCPMSCPKNLRNGACGGVRANGHCEVIPEMRCVWVEAYERSTQMGEYGHEMLHIQPPVNRLLEGKSAWSTMLTGEDKEVPEGWVGISTIPVLDSTGEGQ